MNKAKTYSIFILVFLLLPIFCTVPVLSAVLPSILPVQLPAEDSGGITWGEWETGWTFVEEDPGTEPLEAKSYTDDGYTGNAGQYDYMEEVTEILKPAGTQSAIGFGETSMNIPSSYPSIDGDSWDLDIGVGGMLETRTGAYHYPGVGLGSAGWFDDSVDGGDDISSGYASLLETSWDTKGATRLRFTGYTSTINQNLFSSTDSGFSSGHLWGLSRSASGDFGGGGSYYHTVQNNRVETQARTYGWTEDLGWGNYAYHSRTGYLSGYATNTGTINIDTFGLLQTATLSFYFYVADIYESEGASDVQARVWCRVRHKLANSRYFYYDPSGDSWVWSTSAPSSRSAYSSGDEGLHSGSDSLNFKAWLEAVGAGIGDDIEVQFYWDIRCVSGTGSGENARFLTYLDNVQIYMVAGTIRDFDQGTQLGLLYDSLAWDGRDPDAASGKIYLRFLYWKGPYWTDNYGGGSEDRMDNHVDFRIYMENVGWIYAEDLSSATYGTQGSWTPVQIDITSWFNPIPPGDVYFRFMLNMKDAYGPNADNNYDFYVTEIHLDYEAFAKPSMMGLHIMDYTGGPLKEDVTVLDSGWGGYAQSSDGWTAGSDFDLSWDVRDSSCRYTDAAAVDWDSSFAITYGNLEMQESTTVINGVDVSFEVHHGQLTYWYLDFTSQDKDESVVSPGTAQITIQGLPSSWTAGSILPNSNGEWVSPTFVVSDPYDNTAYRVTGTSANLLTNAQWLVDGSGSSIAWPGNSTNVEFSLTGGIDVAATGQVNASIVNSTNDIVNSALGNTYVGVGPHTILPWVISNTEQPDEMMVEVSAVNDLNTISSVGLYVFPVSIRRNTTTSILEFNQPKSPFTDGIFVDGDTIQLQTNWTDDHLSTVTPTATVAPIISFTLSGTDEDNNSISRTWVDGAVEEHPVGVELIDYFANGTIHINLDTFSLLNPLQFWSEFDVGDYDFTINLTSKATFIDSTYTTKLIQGTINIITDTKLTVINNPLSGIYQGKWLPNTTVQLKDKSHSNADITNGSGKYQGIVNGSWYVYPANVSNWRDQDGVAGGAEDLSVRMNGTMGWTQDANYVLEDFRIPQKAVPSAGGTGNYFINITFNLIPNDYAWSFQNVSTTLTPDGLPEPYTQEVMLQIEVIDNPDVIFPNIHMVPDGLGGVGQPEVIWYNASKDWVLLFAHFGNESDPVNNGFVNSSYYVRNFPAIFNGTGNNTDSDINLYSENWPAGSTERYDWTELIPYGSDNASMSLPDYHLEAYPFASGYWVPDFNDLNSFIQFDVNNRMTWGWYWVNLSISVLPAGRQILWTWFEKTGPSVEDPTKTYDPTLTWLSCDITPNEMKFSYWEDNPNGYFINPKNPFNDTINLNTYWYADIMNFSWKIWDGSNGDDMTQDSWLLKGADLELDIDPGVNPLVVPEESTPLSEVHTVVDTNWVIVNEVILAVEGVYNISDAAGLVNYYNESEGASFSKLDKNITLSTSLPPSVTQVRVNYSTGTGYYSLEIDTAALKMNASLYSFIRRISLQNYSAVDFSTGFDVEDRPTDLSEITINGTIEDVNTLNEFRQIYSPHSFSWYGGSIEDYQILPVGGVFTINVSYNESSRCTRQLGPIDQPNVTFTIERQGEAPFYMESKPIDPSGYYNFSINSSEHSIMTSPFTGIDNEFIVKVYTSAFNYENHNEELHIWVRKRPAALVKIETTATNLPIGFTPIYNVPQGGKWLVVVMLMDPTDNDKLLTYVDTNVTIECRLFGPFSQLSRAQSPLIRYMKEIPGKPGYYFVEFDTWENMFMWWDPGRYHVNIVIEYIIDTYAKDEYDIGRLTYENGNPVYLELNNAGPFGPLTIPVIFGAITGLSLCSVYSAYVGIKVLRTPYALRKIRETQKQITRNKKTHAGIMKSREQQMIEEAETKLEIFGIKLEPLAAKKLPPPILKQIKKKEEAQLPALKDEEIRQQLAEISDLTEEERQLFFKEIKGLAPNDQRVFINGLKEESD